MFRYLIILIKLVNDVPSEKLKSEYLRCFLKEDFIKELSKNIFFKK